MWDNLYCFEKCSGHDCTYLNMAVRSITPAVLRKKYDLIIFHDLLLSRRWRPEQFAVLLKKMAPLKNMDCLKVATIQDEYFRTDDYNKFINDFSVTVVFTLAEESQYAKLYNQVDRSKVKFIKVLTGYLDQCGLKKIASIAKDVPEKNIDIGYRAVAAPACWGRQGYLKYLLGETFNREVRAFDLVTDISTRPEATFLGESWYYFLARCKYTIGVEGGSSIIDRDGTIEKKTLEYRKNHPQALFEEFETNCFPGMEGSVDYFSLSPRHLEACATKTCQILIEGNYSGVLKPWQHYIPLKKDFSNLSEVLQIVKEDKMREQITETAYRDIVLSQKYSYEKYVDLVFAESLPGHDIAVMSGAVSYDRMKNRFNKIFDRLSWFWVAVSWKLWYQPKRRFLKK